MSVPQSWGFQATSEVWHGGNSSSYFRSFGEGDVVSMEIDIGNDSLQFFINGAPAPFVPLSPSPAECHAVESRAVDCGTVECHAVDCGTRLDVAL
jgi:hypothetical protein